MSKFNQKAILLAALLQVQKEGRTPTEGICFNVEMATFSTQGADDLAILRIMTSIWSTWPEFSGSSAYPVPYIQDGEDCDPVRAYHAVDDKWTDQYGASRKRLLAFLIAQLQKDTEL